MPHHLPDKVFCEVDANLVKYPLADSLSRVYKLVFL